MLVRNVERVDLDNALAKVNEVFNGNIRYKNIERVSGSRGGGQTFRLTLTVKDSGAEGGRRTVGYNSGRRISAACWHVYGVFFDSLPEQAHIIVSGQPAKRPGDSWMDRNIGNAWNMWMYSDACECDSGPCFVDYLPHPIGGTSW